MKDISVTAHMIVVNEDQFVRFAISSVLPYVDKMLIFDTGSTDKTVETIKSIQSPKIVFEEKGHATPQQLVELRNEQIRRTDTDFFILVDGDEVWPKENLEKLLDSLRTMPVDKIAVFCKTRNAVGDVYHYLPESLGNYKFQGKTGSYNMRGFRNTPNLHVAGVYPLETYKIGGISLNDADDMLFFADTWYLHATHLKRSSSLQKVAGFRLQKIETGIKFRQEELPEVLVLNPQPKRSLFFELAAALFTPLREIKRILKR